jgi:hypothetical protein
MATEDLQQTLLSAIKNRLTNNEKLLDVIMETLHLSADAAYRRIRGEVLFNFEEVKLLSNKYNFSLDEIGSEIKGKVVFNYKPLSSIGLNFESYLTNIRDNLRVIKNLKNPHLYISVNDTPLFQMFNLPHLTRFKFFFWAKSYLQIPEYENIKFGAEKIDPRVLQIGIEAHNIYSSIPTTELYCPEALRGILRQIEFYFESGMFEDNKYVLVLLDNLLELSNHIKQQAEIGHKFTYGNEPNESPNTAFNMYFNDTYLPDNTYYIEHSEGAMTYFTHNIMNTIATTNLIYNQDSKLILDRLIYNSTLISKTSTKERNKFFSELNKTILHFRKKIELELEMEG